MSYTFSLPGDRGFILRTRTAPRLRCEHNSLASKILPNGVVFTNQLGRVVCRTSTT